LALVSASGLGSALYFGGRASTTAAMAVAATVTVTACTYLWLRHVDRRNLATSAPGEIAFHVAFDPLALSALSCVLYTDEGAAGGSGRRGRFIRASGVMSLSAASLDFRPDRFSAWMGARPFRVRRDELQLAFRPQLLGGILELTCDDGARLELGVTRTALGQLRTAPLV
jgi:hypothetical protein